MIDRRAHRDAAQRPSRQRVPEWIVCAGRGRAIVDGMVVCPAGFYMPWTECLLCRQVETTQHDRRLERFCVAGGPTVDETEEEAPVNWGELIVELL
jgi:hypothetical protein